MEEQIYQWTRKDKIRYFFSMIPVLIMMIGTCFVLYPYSVYLPILWMLIYLVVNIFQAACCIGCPYRGHYCPAFFGVYLGNKLSTFLYGDYTFEKKQFKMNARWGEISLGIFLFFPFHWLFVTQWYYLFIYLGLIVLHVALFMPTQCKRCSYNDTCPGGKSYAWLCKFFRKE